MEIVNTGFILYTIKYEACISFYKDILGLNVLYTKGKLTCFDFHGSYLMIEFDDEIEHSLPSKSTRDRTCIRLNVSNVKNACKALDLYNIEYTYQEFDWGIIAKFRDPDGNLIGFRSSKEHLLDIKTN